MDIYDRFGAAIVPGASKSNHDRMHAIRAAIRRRLPRELALANKIASDSADLEIVGPIAMALAVKVTTYTPRTS